MLDKPLAYHITFGTYGTRLHGDSRGTVIRAQNKPGDPIIGRDDEWLKDETSLLKHPLVKLSQEQRLFVESEIPQICQRGDWQFRTCAAKEDHVHTLLSTNSDGKIVRQLLKRWLGQALSLRWPLPSGQSWWAECGSVKWVWTQDYFDRAYSYVDEQRTTK